jgi:NADH-ubiquinone oxidoreductase chain 6
MLFLSLIVLNAHFNINYVAMYFFFFLIFSNLAVFFGLVLVFFQNPMYSILSLVGCILFSVMILFMYGIEFMSFIYLVVYIGAIAILFLFMIMMLNINSINSLPNKSGTISFFLYICIFLKSLNFMFLINKNIFLFYLDSLQRLFFIETAATIENAGVTFVKYNFLEIQKSFTDNLADLLISGLDSTSELAGFCLLYNVYTLYIILAGFILLLAMLGSISLCIAK